MEQGTSSEPYFDMAELLRAIAHPARLAILRILGQGETCVCHLAALLRKRQPYISQHLMVLREAGLVRDRREGLMVYYALTDPRLAELVDHVAEIARAQGKPADLPEIPKEPLEGCSCPQCTAHFALQQKVG